MHPRSCVSAISTFKLDLAEDLAFWERHGIDTVGVSVAKLERFGWSEGTKLVADAVGRGLRVANLIGLGPFNLADPTSWTTGNPVASLDATCQTRTTASGQPFPNQGQCIQYVNTGK